MLYEDFDSALKINGSDFFKGKVDREILSNLNPVFAVREYQKEAIGRFMFYNNEYQQKKRPVHLLFNMATGSGKTLIMAASILYLYQKGYRNFIFFVRSTTIIEKTKENFLNPLSLKYLFADKIQFGEREVKLRIVENFEAASQDDINILFATTSLLHTRLNFPKEDALAYEDLAEKKIVLIADEAHNLMADTLARRSKTEEEEHRSWENTARRILGSNEANMLLEFTATARLNLEAVAEEYKDKVIYRYDLKAFRLDGFSKEVKLLQVDRPVMERALSAMVISQYRRKVAEKYKIALKPVVLFKANRVTALTDRSRTEGANPQLVVSNEFKTAFHAELRHLTARQIDVLRDLKNPILQKAFAFFDTQSITSTALSEELKTDFGEEKCLSVDEEKDLQEKQVLLNNLESPGNEIRAVFATEKLNEGWDVLNLFDIVRLYNTRDARANRPGTYTVQEAQLIGRGARYYPFVTEEFTDPFTRKFDSDALNELRSLEELYYHSAQNSDYISELNKALVESGIMPERTTPKELNIKDAFKETAFWKKGLIFLNKQTAYVGDDVFGLDDAGVDADGLNLSYQLSSDATAVDDPFTGERLETKVKMVIKEVLLKDFGNHVIRAALQKYPEYEFARLKKRFGNVLSLSTFIEEDEYLGKVGVKVEGPANVMEQINQRAKFEICVYVFGELAKKLRETKKEHHGTELFTPAKIKKIFYDKTLQLDSDSPRAQNMRDFDFQQAPWFAQNEIWGTSEEESFLQFMKEIIDKLQRRYNEIALLRNESFFPIYNFSDGQPFYPDFVLFLKKKQSKDVLVYQVFIEPKGNQFRDAAGGFENSQEGWKQNFLLEIEKRYKPDFKFENKEFRLLGLPFYNDKLKHVFEEAFVNKLM